MRAEGLQAAKKLWRVMKRSKGGCKYMGGEMNLSGVLGKQVGERDVNVAGKPAGKTEQWGTSKRRNTVFKRSAVDRNK